MVVFAIGWPCLTEIEDVPDQMPTQPQFFHATQASPGSCDRDVDRPVHLHTSSMVIQRMIACTHTHTHILSQCVLTECLAGESVELADLETVVNPKLQAALAMIADVDLVV
jgi:hypothetical protein